MESNAMQATLTSKGQITFPKAIRDQLGLQAGDKLEFSVFENGQLLITPKKSSVTALKGMLPKPKKPISLEDMESAIAMDEKNDRCRYQCFSALYNSR